MDLLATPEDLRRWLISSGVASAVDKPAQADLDAARRLREAFFALASGGSAKWAVAAVNTVAAAEAAVPVLSADGHVVRAGSAASHLSVLAREAVLLFGRKPAARVRACEGEGCGTLFLDASRKGDRRWCSMGGCGNRAKVAAFRKRGRREMLDSAG
ncbi:CGNR zinc finger domain-containing protein [Sphingomonas sp. IC-56]|nr:CGNR zinc finger domain-containing protein [Sphingomonas sp. IC-56]